MLSIPQNDNQKKNMKISFHFQIDAATSKDLCTPHMQYALYEQSIEKFIFNIS